VKLLGEDPLEESQVGKGGLPPPRLSKQSIRQMSSQSRGKPPFPTCDPSRRNIDVQARWITNHGSRITVYASRITIQL
jgi:hypothetical protein